MKTRLSNHPALNYNVIHPILFQTDSYFTTLAINYHREESYHNGANSTVNLIKRNGARLLPARLKQIQFALNRKHAFFDATPETTEKDIKSFIKNDLESPFSNGSKEEKKTPKNGAAGRAMPTQEKKDLSVKILGNYEISEKCLNPIEWSPSAQSPCHNENFVNPSKKLLKNRN